jgi:galactosamine-6-phosphate isomerase
LAASNHEIVNHSDGGIRWRGPAADVEEMSRSAAEMIVEELRRKPDLLLCAAAGSTPTRCYALLAEARRRDAQTFSRLRVLKLDEWSGLPVNDPATCEAYLRHHVIEPLGISADRYITFDSNARDPQQECERVRARLTRQSPIDLCLLGLGVNGHLGLNEPADALQPFMHVTQLADSSRQHAMLDTAARRPEYGMTLGMAEILAAHKVLLLVSGATKREPLARLRIRQVSTLFPASLLWLHGDVTCFYDNDAAQD